MDATTNSEAQLLAEHFGYPPVSLLDDIINSINILAEQALNSVEKGLLSVPPVSLGFRAGAPPPPAKSKSAASKAAPAPPPPEQLVFATAEEAHRHEVENGTHQLETLLCASIDRNFDLFELWVMRNILTVRPDDRDWIRLSHYEGLDFSAVATARERKKKGRRRRRPSDAAAGSEGGGGGGGSADDVDDGDEGPGGGHSLVPTVESVSRLRRRLQASQKLNVMLHAERARNAALLDELRAVLLPSTKSSDDAATVPKMEPGSSPAAKQQPPPPPPPPSLAFLRNRGDLTVSDSTTPLTTTAAFSLSQLQALRALSTSLRTMLPDLRDVAASAAGGGGSSSSDAPRTTGGSSWRTERVEYVEGAARKHLENVRGLELGRNGEVRDGEWQGPGRSLGAGEVEGLEKVAAALGGSGGGAGGGVDDDGDEKMDG